MLSKNSRAPKQLGDFGEGLVTYALIRKGLEVECVGHVGADLIAQKNVCDLLFKTTTLNTNSVALIFCGGYDFCCRGV